MATKGTVTIYRHTTPGTDETFWYAEYAYLDGESMTVRLQPSVGPQASAAQLQYHADQGLRAQMQRAGEPYIPTVYSIE